MNSFATLFVSQLTLVPPAMYFIFIVWYLISIFIMFKLFKMYFKKQLILIYKTVHEEYAKKFNKG